jgi:hypothetical protein
VVNCRQELLLAIPAATPVHVSFRCHYFSALSRRKVEGNDGKKRTYSEIVKSPACCM